MAAATATPSPRDLFALNPDRAARLHEEATTAVLAQCRERLRRGVPAHSVTVFLRGQYRHLAALAAAVEILRDAVDDPAPVEEPARGVREPRQGVVRPENVRYAPFGNAAPRPASRKWARA